MRPLIAILFSFALFSCGNRNSKSVIFSDNAPKPIGPYSQAVRHGNLVFVSGQIGITFSGELDTSSIEKECRQALNNIEMILEEAGMTMANVVKTTIYLTDLNHFQKVNETYGGYFISAPPARETVEVKALPKGARVEISAIAAD